MSHNILDEYKSPRDAIPMVMFELNDAEMRGGKIKDRLSAIGLDSDEAISLLLLEINRLHNNMISCRKAAKRAAKDIRDWKDSEMSRADRADHELNHIIKVVDQLGGTDWWE